LTDSGKHPPKTLASFAKRFGFSTEAAGAILGIYSGSVYLSSLPGGWIADRWLG